MTYFVTVIHDEYPLIDDMTIPVVGRLLAVTWFVPYHFYKLPLIMQDPPIIATTHLFLDTPLYRHIAFML